MSDPGENLEQYDGALLTTLEGEGTTDQDAFISTIGEARDTPRWPVPSGNEITLAWIADAERRGLVKLDEGFITLTRNGRDRLIALM